MSEKEIEQEIQSKGLTAPRLTPESIDAVIVDEDYHVFTATCLTVCCLTLANGFTVTGESACASPENFDAEIGRKIARGNARDKVWQLEGYLLKQSLSNMSASEALFGFAGWITTRNTEVVASAHHDAGVWAQLVVQFCYENKLTDPREGWENNLVHPSGECSGAAISGVEPHKQRVIDEKNELDNKAKMLSDFIGMSSMFEKLDVEEQERMRLQNDIMWQYSEVLGHRIDHF